MHLVKTVWSKPYCLNKRILEDTFKNTDRNWFKPVVIIIVYNVSCKQDYSKRWMGLYGNSRYNAGAHLLPCL